MNSEIIFLTIDNENDEDKIYILNKFLRIFFIIDLLIFIILYK